MAMTAFCVSMGFATDLLTCALFRFGAGLVSSSIVVVSLTMICDLSRDPAERARNIAKLPLIAVFGAIGPVIQGIVASSVKQNGEFWQQFPTLSGQIACASVLLVIAATAAVMLDEVRAFFFLASSLMNHHILTMSSRPFLKKPNPPIWIRTVKRPLS